jgi:ribosomal protein S18 acetylase RimI-like enzyme
VTEVPIAIARARHDQLPEVRRLAGVIWRAHYPGIISEGQIDYMLERGYAIESLRNFLDAADRGLELATAGPAIAAFAAWYVMDDRETAKIDKLYVLQSMQRRGIGGRLIARVEAHARNAGARTLSLNVNKNNTQAVNAYHKHGFAVREAVVVDIGGGFVMDDYVMAKAL